MRYMSNLFRNTESEKGRQWISPRTAFIGMGILSGIWIFWRVLTKPSRASYPCIRVAAPVMSAFIVYLLSLASQVMIFRVFRRRFRNIGFLPAVAFVGAIGGSVILTNLMNPSGAKAFPLVDKAAFIANDPIGVAKGIHPGRVVWVWDAEATDETCTNTAGDYWFENTNAGVVENMLTSGIMNLAGAENPVLAWNAIFRHFNSEHGKGNVGYTPGEKVYIKINITNSCCSVTGTEKFQDFERMDATPELVLAMLKNLIEFAGVAQSDIYCGDPFRTFHDLYWDMCHSVYPDVVYTDGIGINGRHQTVPTNDQKVIFSDGVNQVRIPQEYVESAYFINMPCLKSHDSGGISLGAKNHQGSILQDGVGSDGQSAYLMHYTFPDQNDTPDSYRHLVDYMGHEELGGKTLFVVVDGIWAGKSWEGYVEKWTITPFNNDYPNSLLLSQDLVALESVGWDFLLAEYENKDESEKYPYMQGVEDYILQAADPATWPSGITYDPENDGSPITSLGVYEHWNNATDKMYSRNQGTGDGIELFQVFDPGHVNAIHGARDEASEQFIQTYPNPASEGVTLEYELGFSGNLVIEVLDMKGKTLVHLRSGYESEGMHSLEWDASELVPGIYHYRIRLIRENGEMIFATKQFSVVR